MSTIDDIRTRLVNKLLEQGLLFLFLGLGIWYFNGENKKLQLKVTNCHHAQIQFFQEQTDLVLETVKKRTEALERMEKTLEEMVEKR